jgi:TRAP-type C4-dicarboxylate transport system permease small subunit
MNSSAMSSDEKLDAASRIMHALSAWVAILGGAILAAIGGLVVTSVTLRALGYQPVQGDFELVQVGLAAAIALLLPWCQLRGGNIIVDFFTTRARIRTQRRLDAFAAVLVALMMALVAWRAAVGAYSAHQNGETTMILGFPIWWSYAAMTPGLALTSVVALFCAWQAWSKSRHA